MVGACVLILTVVVKPVITTWFMMRLVQAQAWPFVSIGSSSGSDGSSSLPFSVGTFCSAAPPVAGTGSDAFALPLTSGIEVGKPLETGVMGCELQGVVALEDKELSLEETTFARFPSPEP